MRLLLIFLTLVLIITTTSVAGGYEITNVIEVGPAARIPFIGPLKWSPDGTRLAYFAHDQLMITDTLGNSSSVAKMEQQPRRFEWISDDEIAIMLVQRQSGGSSTYALTVFDVKIGQARIVDQFVRRRDFGVGDVFLDGPFRSLEGNAYYIHKVLVDGFVETPLGRHGKSVDELRLLGAKGAADHVLRWDSLGLYRVTLSGTDSLRICGQPNAAMWKPTEMSPDHTHIVNGGLLIRLADEQKIVLDTMHFERPAGAVCSFGFVTFSPIGTEVLFHLSCDDGENQLFDKIGTFDYSSNEFKLLNADSGLEDCVSPVFGLDGRKIAVLCQGVLYIIEREEL